MMFYTMLLKALGTMFLWMFIQCYSNVMERS